MDSTVKKKFMVQPITIAELLPGLCGIVSKDTINVDSVKKQPKQPQTAEKRMKPLTLAEMRADLLAIKTMSPKRNIQPDASTKKKMWNSSAKVVNKTKSHTSEGQMKHNSVRKVLNFQTKTRPQNPRATIMNAETPKFPRPEFRAKKSLHINKTNIRISGVYPIPETPVVSNKLVKNRFTMQNHSNKENTSYLSNLNKKNVTSPKPFRQPKKLPIPDTPLSNMSFKSSSDASFLQKEKEINDIEEKTKALVEEPTLENIAEVSPPVSTPFKEYRNVKDFFNNTNENSVLYNDNTIMSFNKDSENKENSREESVIVSLCDLLNKAKIKTSNPSTELQDLLEVQKQKKNNIEMIENVIKTLQNIKKSELETLQYVTKLINEKRLKKSPGTNKDITAVPLVCESEAANKENVSPARSPLLRPSVIKTKSPSYKIPKKNLCLRKKVICKSMPDVPNGLKTPEKNDKAINMYMQMKEKMDFLNTPLVKYRNIEPVDTPMVTSYNLQMQLDKLYNAS